MSDDAARFARYEATRTQVAQIKCVVDSDEHRAIVRALERVQRAHGYGSTREAFVESLLAQAARAKPTKARKAPSGARA